MEQLVENDCAGVLQGTHVLIVEDSFLILMELESILTEAGAEAVWACHDVRQALQVLAEQTIDVAILDFQLDRETSMPIAHKLAGRGLPFCFYTGQLETTLVSAQWPECKVIAKPAEPHTLVATMKGLVARGAER